MIKWEKYIKKYIWNENATPFFVSVPNLSKQQANKELFLFAVFLGTPFILVAATAMALVLDQQLLQHAILFLYAASVAAAGVAVHWRKSANAAKYCMTGPVAILVYFAVFGFPPKLQFIDQAIVVVVNLLWLRYSFRVLGITRRYESLRDTPPPL